MGKDLLIYQWKNIILLVYSKREKAHDLKVTWYYVVKPRVVLKGLEEFMV